MYQPSMPCGLQVPRWDGFWWTITLVPGGANGVLLKSKEPSRAAYAESLGLRRQGRNMFKVSAAWGNKSAQRFMGKWGWTEHSPAMR